LAPESDRDEEDQDSDFPGSTTATTSATHVDSQNGISHFVQDDHETTDSDSSTDRPLMIDERYQPDEEQDSDDLHDQSFEGQQGAFVQRESHPDYQRDEERELHYQQESDNQRDDPSDNEQSDQVQQEFYSDNQPTTDIQESSDDRQESYDQQESSFNDQQASFVQQESHSDDPGYERELYDQRDTHRRIGSSSSQPIQIARLRLSMQSIREAQRQAKAFDYQPTRSILDHRGRGRNIRYLVEYEDGYRSWEPLDHMNRCPNELGRHRKALKVKNQQAYRRKQYVRLRGF